MNALPVYDDRYIKTKISIFGDKVYHSFHAVNAPEDGVECKFFTISSNDSLLNYENIFYQQVYLENFAEKFVDKDIILIINLLKLIKIIVIYFDK